MSAVDTFAGLMDLMFVRRVFLAVDSLDTKYGLVIWKLNLTRNPGKKAPKGSHLTLRHAADNADFNLDAWKIRMKEMVANQDDRIEFEIVFN